MNNEIHGRIQLEDVLHVMMDMTYDQTAPAKFQLKIVFLVIKDVVSGIGKIKNV